MIENTKWANKLEVNISISEESKLIINNLLEIIK